MHKNTVDSRPPTVAGTFPPGQDTAATNGGEAMRTHGAKPIVHLHPVLIALGVILITALLTHLVPAGSFLREHGHVVPGTYQLIEKNSGLSAVFASRLPHSGESPARAASLISTLAAVPAGFVAQAPLIVMLMFAGAVFGVLRATGAIDAAIDDLLHVSAGNASLLVACVLLLIACGATFLGFGSEYVAIVPLVLSLTTRLKLPNLIAAAIVILGMDIGYIASVTNPNVLAVAQPLAGVPIFSGIGPRFGIFVAMAVVVLCYVMFYLRRLPRADYTSAARRLTPQQIRVLVTLGAGAAALVAGTSLWSWKHEGEAAAFFTLSVLLALVGGLRWNAAADALIDGMRSMTLPVTMIGLGGSVGHILVSSQIQDTIVRDLAILIQGQPHATVAAGLMVVEMAFGLLIHSVSAKAAISIPILAPIAHLSGVSGQVTVTALLLGSGLVNMVSPTNGLLLAFLSSAGVSYVAWVRFVAPLFAVLCLVGFSALYVVTTVGS